MVSPGHSICVDVIGEVLIPALHLVNGCTIIQTDITKVVYWHIELDEHDIILAEGLPTESYLDMGNRDFFAENQIVALGEDSLNLLFVRMLISAVPSMEKVNSWIVFASASPHGLKSLDGFLSPRRWRRFTSSSTVSASSRRSVISRFAFSYGPMRSTFGLSRARQFRATCRTATRTSVRLAFASPALS